MVRDSLVWLKPVKADSSLSEPLWSGLIQSNQVKPGFEPVKTGFSRSGVVCAGLNRFDPVKTGLSPSIPF